MSTITTFEETKKFEIADYYFDNKQVYIEGIAKLSGWNQEPDSSSFDGGLVDGVCNIETEYEITIFDDDKEIEYQLPLSEVKKVDEYVKDYCERLF